MKHEMVSHEKVVELSPNPWLKQAWPLKVLIYLN